MPCGMNGFLSSCGRRYGLARTGTQHGQTCTQNPVPCSSENGRFATPRATGLPRHRNVWMRLFPHIMVCSPRVCLARKAGLCGKTCPARLMTSFSPRGPNLKIPFGRSHNGWTNAFPQRLWTWRVKHGFRTGGPFFCMHARLLSLRITRYRRWSARLTKIPRSPLRTRMPHPMDAA